MRMSTRPWWSTWASTWVGSSRPCRAFAFGAAAVAVFVFGLPSSAAEELPETQPVGSIVELLIGLPPDARGGVLLHPGTDRFRLELPSGATLPADFGVASGGILRARSVERVGNDRLRLDVELLQGSLDEVSFSPDSLRLRFYSRSRPVVSAEDPGALYRLGPTDRLRIAVQNHPDLSGLVTVSDDGLVAAPLVGNVQAAGLTPRQLAVKLADLLGRRYLVEPQVSVEVEEYRSQWVIVSGEVQRPGRVALRGGTRLKEVMGEVGGPTSTAGDQIKISRRGEGEGVPVTLMIERSRFESGEINPVLAQGDIIEVSESKFCFVQGEVKTPGVYGVGRGLTLLKVLALSGGLTEWASRKDVRILYYDDPTGGAPRERIFNLNRIESGRSEDPILKGDEMVIVRRRSL